jgi:hypothetical protein
MYSTIILNIGGWEWMDASVQLWMTLRAPSVLGRCHQFGLPGLFYCCWATWAQFFMVEIVYLGSYNVFTRNTLIFMCLGDQEWMDGEGCCWMTFGRYFCFGNMPSIWPAQAVFCSCARCAHVSTEKKVYYSI